MVVHTPLIDDRRLECGEEGNGSLQLLLPLWQEGPVGAIAPARRILVHLGEHPFADGEVVAYGVLYKEEGRVGGASERQH